jgi:hypothetical protein
MFLLDCDGIQENKQVIKIWSHTSESAHVIDGVRVCKEVPLSLVDNETKMATRQQTPMSTVVAVALEVEVLNVKALF